MNVRYDAPMEMPGKFPEEMPNQKELEKEEVSIIPAPLINPKEEGGNNNGHYRTEKRLEVMPPLPIVVLPGKKIRRVLNNWVKKEMGNYPETWNGFFAYFDKEPVHNGKVGGYVVEPCSKWEKYDFEFKGRYYKVSDYKFDEIEGAKSTFYNVLNNNMSDYTKNKINKTGKEITEVLGGGNNQKRK